jgi:hypothetical protein
MRVARVPGVCGHSLFLFPMHAWPAICVNGGFAREIRKTNAFEAFGWNVYDFSGTWASPLELLIASARQERESMRSRPIPSIWMEPAMPTHLRVWM